MTGIHSRRWPWLLLLLLGLAGCGRKVNEVNGTVTFNGAQVDNGYITFYPVDDRAAAKGGEIRGGKYSVSGVTPGRRRVLVQSQPRLYTVAGAGGSSQVRAAPAANPIHPTAIGNNEIVEVGKGKTNHDIELKSGR